MNKVMNIENLDEIMTRLDGCSSLLYLLYESAGMSCVPDKAIGAVCDLLNGIRKDFRADVEAAEEVTA